MWDTPAYHMPKLRANCHDKCYLSLDNYIFAFLLHNCTYHSIVSHISVLKSHEVHVIALNAEQADQPKGLVQA